MNEFQIYKRTFHNPLISLTTFCLKEMVCETASGFLLQKEESYQISSIVSAIKEVSDLL